MARPKINSTTGDGHFGYGELLQPAVVDALVASVNEHATKLDTLVVQSITGTTDAQKVTSLIAALVALGLATDDTV